MAKQTLESLFEAMYHGKHDYTDFINSPVSTLCKKVPLKNRVFYKADEKLRAYHKFLNLFIFDFLRINTEVVYSYRKGINVIDAVQKHANSRHFLQADLKNFFGSIDSTLIKSCILENIDNLPASDIDTHIDRLVSLVSLDDMLPPGFSTSPPLSNACLYGFDNKIEAYCKAENLIYTRYSDDIIISGSSDRLYGLSEIIENFLQESFEKKLQLNPSKTKYNTVGGKIKLLGVVILPGGELTVDSKLKSKVEVMLHYYLTDRPSFNKMIEQDTPKGLSSISGYLNYINTTDQTYLNKLRLKYGATVVDMFIRGSVK
jgi:RNA-directed DNA polymerase